MTALIIGMDFDSLKAFMLDGKQLFFVIICIGMDSGKGNQPGTGNLRIILIDKRGKTDDGIRNQVTVELPVQLRQSCQEKYVYENR